MNSPPFPLTDKPQVIKYGTESDHSAYITSKDVIVHSRSGIHNHGSSKVKLTNRIDYNWELRYYQGQLVAVHINGKVIAYAMKGKDGGMVRLVNQETDQRALIKNLKTDVRDVSFAFLRNEIILGCVDEEGNVLIYEVDDQPIFIKYKLLLHIYHPELLNNSPSNYRIVWCPYLPSVDDDPDVGDETAKMFVFLNGSKAEVWDVCLISAKYNEGPVQPDENYEGYVEIDHSMDLVDVSFSSDGTAVATACLDGYVKFYQIYMVDNEKQKLLHEWIPHDGMPLSCLIFIDNILEYSADSRFWKFAITGANHNSELKLWSCETWSCLQTIQFKSDPTSIIPNLFFKICIDHSGQYVVMSDINNKILYILQIKRSDAEKVVAVTTISQFLLPSPFLSFHITKAEIGKMPFNSNSTEELYDEDEFEEDTDLNSIFINLLVIQPKKFQECKIVFIPDTASATLIDLVEDVITDKLISDVDAIPQLNDLQSSVTLLIQQQTNKSQLNLMKPEDFTSPAQNSRSSSLRNSLEPAVMVEKHLNTSVENLIDFQRPQKGNFASAGSSPSREVQEILSLNNSTYSNQEYYENLSKMQDEETPTKHYNPKDNLIFPDSSNKEMIWPKIPVVKDNGIVKEDNLRQDLALTGDDVNKDYYKNHLQTLNFRLTSLETAIREQTLVIESLQQELKAGKMKQNNINNDIREDISKEMDLVMSKHQIQIAKLLENVLSMQKTKEREHHENVVSSMSQLINKTLTEKIQNVVTHEVKHALLPAVMGILESLKHQLDLQYSQKVASADITLRENITKMISNKAVTDSLSKSIVSIITPNLEKCYRDMITISLIPSWERICGNMFQQINDTFTQGTKEYTASIETYMDRQRRAQEKSKDLITQFSVATENIKVSTDKLSSTVTSEIQRQFNVVFKNVQDRLASNVREIVSEEIKVGFKNHASVIEDSVMNAVRSRSVTPASHVVDSHVKLSKIQHNLTNGNFDEALQLALSAENLQYVVYVCEKVDVNTLFGGPRLLPQSCLLALIQQLSMDLQQNTDIKLSYIHAAMLALNRNDPDTKRFVHKVLRDLTSQLNGFINSNPPFKQKSNARLMMMALENMSQTMFSSIM